MAYQRKQWVDPKTLRRIVYMYFANSHKYERFQWWRACAESDIDPRYLMAMVLSEKVQAIVQNKQSETFEMAFNLDSFRDVDLKDYKLELGFVADRTSRFRFRKKPYAEKIIATLSLVGFRLVKHIEKDGIDDVPNLLFNTISEDIPDCIRTIPGIEDMLWNEVDRVLKLNLMEWTRQTCLTKGVKFPSICKQLAALRLQG